MDQNSSQTEKLIFTSTFYRDVASPLRSIRRRFRQGLGRSHPQLVNDDTLHELPMHYAGVVITTTTKISCFDNKRSIGSALTLFTASAVLRRNGVGGAEKRLPQQTQVGETTPPGV